MSKVMITFYLKNSGLALNSFINIQEGEKAMDAIHQAMNTVFPFIATEDLLINKSDIAAIEVTEGTLDGQ